MLAFLDLFTARYVILSVTFQPFHNFGLGLCADVSEGNGLLLVLLDIVNKIANWF